MICQVKRLRQAIRESVGLNGLDASMYKLGTKPDPFDPVPLINEPWPTIDDPDNPGTQIPDPLYIQAQIPDPLYIQKTIPDPLTAPMMRGIVKCRIVKNGSGIKPYPIESGIGVVGGQYLISDNLNEFFENDVFAHGGISYKIGPVEKLLIFTQIIGYRAVLTKAI